MNMWSACAAVLITILALPSGADAETRRDLTSKKLTEHGRKLFFEETFMATAGPAVPSSGNQ